MIVILNMVGWERLSIIVILNMVGWERLSTNVNLNIFIRITIIDKHSHPTILKITKFSR
jgi:hypothetical protein